MLNAYFNMRAKHVKTDKNSLEEKVNNILVVYLGRPWVSEIASEFHLIRIIYYPRI